MGRKKEGRLLIWDIESYIWKAATACKTLEEVQPFVYQELYKLGNGIDYLKQKQKELEEAIKATDFVVALGDSERNFRKEINPDYKSNRASGQRPLMYSLLKDWVVNNFPTVVLPTLEADDTCRVIYEDKEGYGGFEDKVIVSIDKDFYTIPDVKFYRDIPKERTVKFVSKEQADFNLKVQTIMGDSTDGYYGIPGWGKAKALDWLTKEPRSWADVLQLYKDNGLTSADYTKNKMMARLISYKNYSLTEERILNYD